jgi:hemoglobin/transferrin/lactoferrin receptor protein
MKKITLIVFLCYVCFNAFSQVVTIKDSETLQALEYATLHCVGTDDYAVTNQKGRVDISRFNNCNEIEIRMLGYVPKVLSYDKIVSTGNRVYLEQSSITLDQVVISATKWKQPKRDIPVKIATLSAKDISFYSPQTSADLLGSSGEVFVQKSQQSGGSPMLRGFATNRIVISVDGVRMNTAIFRSGNIQNVISIDPFSVEQTEVLFGPGSVIYGSDAIGGVMSFKTLQPDFGDKDSVNIGGSTSFRTASANKEMTGHFDVNVGWEKFAMLTSISYNNFGDLRMGSYGPQEYLKNFYVQRFDTLDIAMANSDPEVQILTTYSQMNVMQKFSYKPSDKWLLNYNFQYSTSSNNARYDRLIRTKNGLPRSAEWYYGPQEWMMNNFSIENSGHTPWYDEMVIRIAHQHFEESRHDRDFNKKTRYNRYEDVDAISANFDFTKSLTTTDKLNYGVEAVYDIVESKGIDENVITGEKVAGPSRYPQSDWASYAAYLTYDHKFSKKFDASAGLRYNYYILNADFDTTFYPFPFTTAKLNNGALTGSIGFVYNPAEKFSLGFNSSTGFRSPNVDDMGKVFDSEPGSVIVPNPNLKAEYAYNVELSLAKIFGEFLKTEIVGYYIYLDNALVRRDFTMNGLDSLMYDGEMSKIMAVQNAAFAQVYGLQAGAEIKFPAGFGISSRFNWQKGIEELEDGTTSPLRHAAPWFGKTALNYSAQKLKLSFYTVYSGEVSFENMPDEEIGKSYMYAIDEDGNPYSPAWLTYNFRAQYQFNDNFAINAGIENITDLRYRPYSCGIVAPGRNFVAGIKAVF